MQKIIRTLLPILCILSASQMSAMWWKKKPKKSTETQVTWREVVETTDDLARAIKKNDQKEITNIIDSILNKQIENKIMYRAQSEIDPEYKEIAKLVAERKKAKEEEAKIACRATEIPKIKKKVIESNVVPADVAGVIAEYAVE